LGDTSAALWVACAGFVSVVAIVVGELRGKSIFGPRPEGALADTRAALVIATCGWMLAPYALWTLVRLAGLDVPTQILVGGGLHVLVALTVFRAAASGARRPSSAPSAQVGHGVVAGLATFGIVFVLSIGVVAFYGALGVSADDIPKQDSVALLKSATLTGRLLIIFSACVLAPFAEEIVFRGALFPALSHVISERLALVVQALIFGFIHFYAKPAAWPLVVPIAAVGWCAGWTFARTGSLRAAIVLHMTFNSVQVGLLFATSAS